MREQQFKVSLSNLESGSDSSIEMVQEPGSGDTQPRKQKEKGVRLTFREEFATFPWKTVLLIATLPIALAPIVTLATAAETASVGYLQQRDCYPNGLWNQVSGATWRIMDSSYFFTPNLSFGKMTFTQVKVIDIAWDLVIGRGGQLLLAWVNYRVFNEWVVYHMEMHLTSYKMYTAIAFQTTTLSTLGVLGKEVLAFGETSWRRFFRWLAILSMLLSTMYVLSFPTLMAAMTGYLTTYEAYVEGYNNELVPFHNFVPIHTIIQDSARIGNYGKPLIAHKNDKELKDAITKYLELNTKYGSIGNETENRWIQPGTTFEDFTYCENKSSAWSFGAQLTQLTPPTLNITMLSNVKSAWRDFDEFYTPGGRQGDVYNSSYVLSHGSCKPSDTYQWGFSYIFLFMVSIFNFVWACIMVGMWFDTSRESRMYKGGWRPGLLRSILDISAVVREEIGEGVDKLQEEDLRRAVRDSGGALVVPKNELRIARTTARDAGSNKRGWTRTLKNGSTF